MKISLLTPSYNHAEFIGRTIDSVLSQRGDFDLEYIVLDGASRDGTIEILNSYGTKLTWSSEPDNGQVDAINKGLQKISGDVVGWLNSDDVLLPGALQKVCDAFQQTGCKWLHGDCRVIDRHDRVIRKWVAAVKRFHAKRYSRERLLAQNFISQMTVFWRRELMSEVGLLDPTLPLAFDYDYWLRFAEICDPYFIDSPIAAFRWYTTSKSGASYATQCLEDEKIASRHGIAGWKKRSKQLQNRLRIGVYRVCDAIGALSPNSTVGVDLRKTH